MHYSTRTGSFRPHRCLRRMLRFALWRGLGEKQNAAIPGRAQAMACSTMPGTEAATIDRSAPRPLGERADLRRHIHRAGIPAVIRAAARGDGKAFGDGVGGGECAPARWASMVNIRPIGPCPITTTNSPGCGAHLHHSLKAGVERFHQRGPLEGSAFRNPLHAALHNPWHHAHVLGEASPRGLESGCDPHLFIHRALRVSWRRQ